MAMTAFPDAGGGHRRHWGGGGTDSLEGEALAIGRKGEVVARYPQLAVLDVNTGILEPREQERAVALARHYVRWLRRELIVE